MSLSRKFRMDRLYRALRAHRDRCTECWNACGPALFGKFVEYKHIEKKLIVAIL